MKCQLNLNHSIWIYEADTEGVYFLLLRTRNRKKERHHLSRESECGLTILYLISCPFIVHHVSLACHILCLLSVMHSLTNMWLYNYYSALKEGYMK